MMEFTIFEKPSGNIRGFGVQMMTFPKGKSGTEEKRICHSHVFEDQPLDYISVDVPKRLSPDQAREVAAKLIEFANGIEAQYALPRGATTCQQVLKHYQEILQENPGKALFLKNAESAKFVAIIHDECLMTALLGQDGAIKDKNIGGEFDTMAWNADRGHWVWDANHMETMSMIHSPTMLDYTVTGDTCD